MGKGLILEIGGGHNPHYSSVVVDKFLYDNTQRGGVLRVDRPTIAANGEHLPFRERAFEYSIARQVMEHTDNIENLFGELMRISRAGYLTSPSTLSEYLFWWPYHNWFITLKDNTLYCCKKTNESPLFGVLFHYFSKNNLNFKKFIKSLPRHVLNVEYYWQDKINYVIVEQPVMHDFLDERMCEQFFINKKKYNSFEQYIRHQLTKYCPEFIISMIKEILFYRKRVKRNIIDMDKLLVCPVCRSDLLNKQSEYFCQKCSKAYPIKNNIPNFIIE